MAIIEFSGIPHSGKSTTAQALLSHFDAGEVTIHPERFDLVPVEVKTDPYLINRWYAEFCIDRLQKTKEVPGIHIFERGIEDRIAYGKACFYYGRFTSKQLQEYLDMLLPHRGQSALTLVFNVSPSISHARSLGIGQRITRDIRSLECLYQAYAEVRDDYPEVIYVPEDASLPEIESFVVGKIKSVI